MAAVSTVSPGHPDTEPEASDLAGTGASPAGARTQERGAGLVEYALLIGLIVLVCVAGVTLFGGATASQYSSFANLFPE